MCEKRVRELYISLNRAIDRILHEKQEQLPEEGFLHEGVRYTYDVKANNWLADGKALQVG